MIPTHSHAWDPMIPEHSHARDPVIWYLTGNSQQENSIYWAPKSEMFSIILLAVQHWSQFSANAICWTVSVLIDHVYYLSVRWVLIDRTHTVVNNLMISCQISFG